MSADKILYVDDEAMALKYFERLVSPLAPVLVASSVAEGKALLQQRGAEIAVLITDQRMPQAHGNELLSYARTHHPGIVRMLTTAYSDLGEAIEAINSGEIYRYITKPWEMENLRVEVKNALELAALRNERDALLREKLMVQHQQLMSSRIAQLAMVCAQSRPDEADAVLQLFLDSALDAGCAAPPVDWHRWDHADLMQAEARRGVAIAQAVQQSLASWRALAGDAAAALDALAKALGARATRQGDIVLVTDPQVFCWLVQGAPQESATPANTAWIAWLLWQGSRARVRAGAAGWEVSVATPVAQRPLASDWLAHSIEQLMRGTL
jgi:two-component system, probable response regulator PhcQ